MRNETRNRYALLAAAAAAAIVSAIATPAWADPVAYWRFETGPDQTDVLHTLPPGQFETAIIDQTGNGNHLSVWEQGGNAGYRYRTDVPFANVPVLNVPNNFSVKNTGGGPAMFTGSSVSLPSGVDIETMTPAAFTIEVSWKPENGGYRTVVGRDARNISTSNAALAALYLQARPDNSIGINFTDVAGNTHECFTPAGFVQGFNFGSDPDGLTGHWYNIAAVSDGSSVKLYVNGALAASSSIVSADPRLAVGTTSGGDWHAGEWSVGRGLFNGGHADRGYGYIDEVRISNSALSLNQLLVPVLSQTYTWVGAAGAFNTGSNWDLGTAPTDLALHQAVVSNGGTVQIGAGSFNVNELSVGSGSSGVGHVTQTDGILNVGGSVILGRSSGAGDYDISGGTLNAAAITVANVGATANSATFTARGTAVVNVNGGALVVAGGGSLNAGVMTVSDNAVVNVTGGQAIRVGAIGAGTLVLQNSGQINGGTSEMWISNGSTFATATMGMTGGTLNLNNWLAVGRDRGTGTLDLGGGVINKAGNGNIVIGAIGVAQGTINQTGGQIVSVRDAADPNAPGLVDGEVFIGESTEAKGTWNFSGGSASAPAVHVGYTGQGSFNMSGTAQLTTNFLSVSRQGTFSSQANLNGGTITVGQIARGGGTATNPVNFNGTTIVPASDNDRFISGFNANELVLQTGGAVIDTNGKNVGIDSALSGTGQLVKNGAGVMTINAGVSHTYSGSTVVNAGTLRLQKIVSNNSILAKDISAYYKFDDVANLGKDSSPAANDVFDVFGTATISNGTAPPNRTASLSLPANQTNQNFLSTASGNVPANFPVGNDSYTIAAWINVDGTNTNHDNGIVGWGDLGVTPNLQRSSITFRTQNNGGTPNGLRQSWFIVDNAANLQPGTDLVNQWHHVVSVYDANTDIRRIYVDGNLLTEDYLAGINNALPQNFRIGMAALGEAFSGNMSDLLVARSPLTQAQVQQLMAGGVSFGSFTGGSGALSPNSIVQVASGATLDLNGSSSPSGGLGNVGVTGGLVTSSSAGPAVLTLSPVGSTTFSGVIENGAGTVGITKSGAGTQVLRGANTYTGVTTVQAGRLVLAGGAKAPVLSGPGGADVKGGRLVLDYNDTGTTLASQVLAILDAGYDQPTKFSSGAIRTSNPADPNKGLGWKDDTGAKEITVAYTYNGDANLDGQVDINDLASLATAWQTSGVWTNGDFDYSGFIDINDLASLATNWQAGVGAPLGMTFEQALASAGLGHVAVPEPAALGVLGLAAVGVRRRRR